MTLVPVQKALSVSELVKVGTGRGLTVTVVDAEAEGPLHPSATTLTVATPENEGDHVTVPVVPVPEMVFPVPVTDHIKLVAFAAEVVYVVLLLPWQIELAEGEGVEGVATEGDTTTVALAQAVVLHDPVALT